jgi:hypothetical protein
MAKKIKDITVRDDNTVVIITKKKITCLFPDGESVKLDRKTGKVVE